MNDLLPYFQVCKMQFQVEGISENWLKFKKDGIGVEYKGNEICMQTYLHTEI